MSRFEYSAISEAGQRTTGALKARSRREAVEQLVSRGVHPVVLEEAGRTDVGLRGVRLRFSRRVPVTTLAVFTRQLSSLLRAGLTVVDALSILREQSTHKRLIRVIEEVEDVVSQQGTSLAEALDDHPHVFSAVYRGLVRAGEQGGNLSEVLAGLARHLSQSARLRRQVAGAFVYPVFLLLLGIAAIFVLMAFVIPRFQQLFVSFGEDLPWPTAVLMVVSDFTAHWWWAVLLGAATVVLTAVGALRKPALRKRVDGLLLRLPVLGPMFLKLEISRISRTLGALLNNGVWILDALRITADTVHNAALKGTFPAMITGVSQGEALASVAARAKVYPPLMVNLVRTGEETGELPEMLSELSDIYEEEAETAVTAAVKLLEPMLIVVMGGVIAAIVAAVMLPVFQASGMVG